MLCYELSRNATALVDLFTPFISMAIEVTNREQYKLCNVVL